MPSLQLHIAESAKEPSAKIAHLPGSALGMIKTPRIFRRDHGFNRTADRQ